MDAIEVNRRKSATQQVIAFFESRPGIWIDAHELEQFARFAWRTRVSNARREFRKTGGDIYNRLTMNSFRSVIKSEYCYVVQTPVGPPADQYRDQTLWNLPEGR